MILIKTTARTYSISQIDGINHFFMGYNDLGFVLFMSTPKEGGRLTVKYTATGSEDDWEIHVTSQIVKITSTDGIL